MWMSAVLWRSRMRAGERTRKEFGGEQRQHRLKSQTARGQREEIQDP